MEEKNIHSKKTNLNGWHTNTDLGCDIKTILHSDRKMKAGKGYQGVLKLDQEGTIDEFLSRDPHYTFIETLPWSMKRNPRVFNGKYISITRQDRCQSLTRTLASSAIPSACTLNFIKLWRA